MNSIFHSFIHFLVCYFIAFLKMMKTSKPNFLSLTFKFKGNR